jgi:hypothetical protein
MNLPQKYISLRLNRAISITKTGQKTWHSYKEVFGIVNYSNFALEQVPMHLENSIITGIKIA